MVEKKSPAKRTPRKATPKPAEQSVEQPAEPPVDEAPQIPVDEDLELPADQPAEQPTEDDPVDPGVEPGAWPGDDEVGDQVEAPTEQPAEHDDDPEAVAKVTTLPNGWNLVEHKSWSISVGPDGHLMLPRLLKADEVNDFIGAALAAAQVGAKIRADNEERAQNDNRTLPRRRAMVTQGGIPDGAVRMTVTPGPNPLPRGAIGRRTNRPRDQVGLPTVTPPRSQVTPQQRTRRRRNP